MTVVAGRVVVTGIGVLTSLGTGKQDNWRELTAGHSGIRRITRFPIDELRTTIAGTVDFVPVEELSPPALSERLAELVIDEAVAEAGIGSPGDFPGRCSWHCRRWNWSGSSALPSPRPPGRRDGHYDDLLRAAATGKFARCHERFLFGSVAENLAVRFGTKGRRWRPPPPARPAPPRSSSASRRSAAARPRRRW